MSINGGQSRGSRRRGAVIMIAAAATVALLLAACGGGGGGGGDAESKYVMKVAFANETAEAAMLQLDDGEVTSVDTCTGGLFNFNLPATDWVLKINGEPAVDSLEIDPTYLDKNLVANLWLHEDGSIEVERVLPGSNIQPPAKPSICT